MYKPTPEEVAAMPSLSFDDVKNTGYDNKGEPCKCGQCGKPCKNRLGLRVHIQQAHLGMGSRGRPRGPYKAKDSSSLMAPQQKHNPSTVSFCPGCGCNIKAVTMAMKLTS